MRRARAVGDVDERRAARADVLVVIGVVLLVVDGEVVRDGQAAGRGGELEEAVAVVAVGGEAGGVEGRVEGAIGGEVVDVPRGVGGGPAPAVPERVARAVVEERTRWARRSGRC